MKRNTSGGTRTHKFTRRQIDDNTTERATDPSSHLYYFYNRFAEATTGYPSQYPNSTTPYYWVTLPLL